MTKSLSSGNSWVGSNRGITNSYWLNTDIDAVQIWTVTNGAKGSFSSYSSIGTYGAGQLQKNVSEDENGKQVIEFKDKEGKVILKKVQLTAPSDIGLGSAHSGWLCTYYIYDFLDNLSCVIQPKGVELIDPSWSLMLPQVFLRLRPKQLNFKLSTLIFCFI